MPDNERIARELESFYRRYIEIFNRQDTDQLIECFAHPYAAVSGSRGLVPIADIDEHQRSFQGGAAALRNRRWARSGIDSIKAWPLTEQLGFIVSDVTRYKADDSVLESIRACYTVCRDRAAWKIVTIAEIRPPFLGP